MEKVILYVLLLLLHVLFFAPRPNDNLQVTPGQLQLDAGHGWGYARQLG